MKIEIKNEIKDCSHEWQPESGFYLNVCVFHEEPIYCPPCGFVQLEVCPHCGALRLPNNTESWGGLRFE